MNGICGWVGPTTNSDDARHLLDRMLSVLSGKAHSSKRETGTDWGVGLSGLNKNSIDVDTSADFTVALLGRARFNDIELEKARCQQGAARTLARLYGVEREGAFAKLNGPFSVVVLDHLRRSTAIAIDRMGVHSLAYTIAGPNFLFSTSCDAINLHPAAQPGVNPQSIYDYLYFHMIPAPGTFYRNYHRLLPGQYVVYEDGRIRYGQYWSMRFEENKKASFASLKDEFLSCLREGVREAAEGAKTGCFLSGGTDSSTMAGLLGEVNAGPARTYSIGFDESGYDEMEYARLAAKHFATDHHEYYVTPSDIVTAFPLIADAYDQPFGNSSAVPTYYCARMAREDGVERLIGGDGGDELFGGNERYAKQYIFSLYQQMPATLRKGFFGPLISGFPGAGNVPLLRKAKSYIDQASIPMPNRLESYNLLDRIGRERIFTEGFLRLVDCGAPLAHINSIYHGARATSQINRMLALDFRITLADSDLPKVVNSCAIANMDVTFPMLADPVVAFSATLAPELKLKGIKLRYFFKEALRGFLPDEIISKRKHGFGLPFGHWLTKHKPLQQLVADSLQQLKLRGIVNPSFLDELITRHVAVHAGYYGTMVWILVMLEIWLQKHGQEDLRLS